MQTRNPLPPRPEHLWNIKSGGLPAGCCGGLVWEQVCCCCCCSGTLTSSIWPVQMLQSAQAVPGCLSCDGVLLRTHLRYFQWIPPNNPNSVLFAPSIFKLRHGKCVGNARGQEITVPARRFSWCSSPAAAVVHSTMIPGKSRH